MPVVAPQRGRLHRSCCRLDDGWGCGAAVARLEDILIRRAGCALLERPRPRSAGCFPPRKGAEHRACRRCAGEACLCPGAPGWVSSTLPAGSSGCCMLICGLHASCWQPVAPWPARFRCVLHCSLPAGHFQLHSTVVCCSGMGATGWRACNREDLDRRWRHSAGGHHCLTELAQMNRALQLFELNAV